MSRILVVGDPHAIDGYDNDRFTWLGKYITTCFPDHIVVMGDWGDVPSLNKHGKPIEGEGRSLEKDRLALHDSLFKLEAPIAEYNSRRKAARKKLYQPHRWYCRGNHEERIPLYEAEHPELRGMLEREWWPPFLRFGWQIIPFREELVIDGYHFCHLMTLGTMGRPIGGQTGAHLALNLTKKHYSCVVGHDHRYGVVSAPKGMQRIWGINSGCYVNEEYREAWCKQSRDLWDLGVLRLDGCHEGNHDMHTWVTQAELKRRFG